MGGCGHPVTAPCSRSFLLTLILCSSVVFCMGFSFLQSMPICSSVGSFTGCMKIPTSPWSSPQAAGESLFRLLDHLIHLLLLSPCCPQGSSSHSFPPSSLPCSVLPFLKPVFPEVPPSSLRGSAVSCGGSARDSWNQLLALQRPHLQPLPADAWASVPDGVLWYYR